jgi:hypothetical protein
MRVGEWLQEIARLNTFEHAEKSDNGAATSLQIGHNSYNKIKTLAPVF